MVRTPPFRAALAAAAVVAVAACQDDPTPTSPKARPISANVQSSQAAGREFPTADDLDRQVPGFGGFFLDPNGSPTIYLTRGAGRGLAEAALAASLGARGLSVAALRVREGRYGWQQLQRWQDVATEGAFEVPGTVFVDNDETSNRIRIGVESVASIGQVRAALARRGVPDDAVIIERTDPIVRVLTLQNAVRPVMAGLQIQFGGFVCSVGFNATLNGQASFVTASHCTNTQGGVENTIYWQPSAGGPQIAIEVSDPQYIKGGACSKAKPCRYSDASRAAYFDATNQALGTIAKTTTGPNTRDLNITGSFTITTNDCDGSSPKLGGCLVAGEVVNKVGRTTGWTQGAISNTCVNTGVQGSRVLLACQTFVSAAVNGGDSGSGVFKITDGDNVRLAGLLWGGNTAGTEFVFSPLENVQRELGPGLVTH